MASGGYTTGRVLWLMSIDRMAAIYHDAYPASALSSVEGGMSANADDSLFTIAEWWDVERARQAVVKEKRDQEVMALRVAGFTEREIARTTQLDKSAVRRRFKSRLAEIVELLEAEDEAPIPDRPTSLCLSCGERARVWLAGVSAHRWTFIGLRRRDDGKLTQAWYTEPRVVELVARPPVLAPSVGQVYEVPITTTGRRLSPAALVEDPGDDDVRVRLWARQEQQAVEDGDPFVAPVDARVKGGVRVVRPERHAAVCELCLKPSLRSRAMPTMWS